MRKIKKFEPLSVMRISAIAYAAMGLLEGALFSVVFSIAPLQGRDKLPPVFGVMFGTLAIVFFPILFALMGAIFGGLGAVVYNVAARFVGGIEIEVE